MKKFKDQLGAFASISFLGFIAYFWLMAGFCEFNISGTIWASHACIDTAWKHPELLLKASNWTFLKDGWSATTGWWPSIKIFVMIIGGQLYFQWFVFKHEADNDRDREGVYRNLDLDNPTNLLLLHIRQDIALLCKLLTLGGIMAFYYLVFQ